MRLQWALRQFFFTLLGVLKLALLAHICLRAYRIRMNPVQEYGYIIHEFDPWFNYRAAVYLAKRGWHAFFHWYDYMSWYPIGRPVGTTIYPGMQIAAVLAWRLWKQVPKMQLDIRHDLLRQLPASWHVLKFLPGHGILEFGPLTLNEVCCLVPAAFGSLATFFFALLTMETSGSTGAGIAAAAIFAIIPAHLSRSMAGGFDNEAVAISAFCCTFWLWCRSLRTPGSWPIGALAGLAYVTAVASWGGYIFVNNLIAAHAALLVAFGKYSRSVYLAYSLWYTIGTAGATLVPPVGWAPLRSLEQMVPLMVFFVFQLIEGCDIWRRRQKKPVSAWRFFLMRAGVFLVFVALLAAVAATLLQFSYFAPFSSRIRSLIIQHKKTGNPLVDSVAEHKAASDTAYEDKLHHARLIAPFGLLLCWHQRTPAKYFPVIYAMVAYHFSLKMVRLIIICGPIVSMLAGYPLGMLIDWCLEQTVALLSLSRPGAEEDQRLRKQDADDVRTGGMGSIWRGLWAVYGAFLWPQELQDVLTSKSAFATGVPFLNRVLRFGVAYCLLVAGFRLGRGPAEEFQAHAERAAGAISARIVFKTQGGAIIDDYYAGYRWLKANTPDDARIMAWWDYGYQITGVANRTTIADGNTWNHEHIATLGRTLTNPERKAHNVMRHLADYVLVWAGARKNDIGKSPHLARIANSVFPDVCGLDDPKCQKFGIYADGTPTPMMAGSFLYKAVNHNLKPDVALSSKLFKEVHHTKHGLMRIFQVLNVSQESKAWVSDPANRVCDAPGSWYCVGQYPPALHKLIAKRKDFAQLEDFNKQGEKSAYSKLVEKESVS